jgi:hypothetical protein
MVSTCALQEEATGPVADGGIVSANRIDVEAFGLPLEGTLAHSVVRGLIDLAVGDAEATGLAAASGRDVATLSLRVLGSAKTLRFSHKQMSMVLQNLLKGTQDGALLEACVAFAVRLAPRDSAYVIWLYDVATNTGPAVLNVVSTV